MSWTYIPSLDEIDHELIKDASVGGRFTFKKRLYFQPDSYDNWRKGLEISQIPFSAELIGNSNIPQLGSALPPPLQNFYLADVVSIDNLTEEEHGHACSYGVVTLEYENKPGKGGGSSSSGKNKLPWEERVSDFSVSWQEVSVPFTSGYVVNEDVFDLVATTAGQPLYDFTAPVWIGRITWTYNTNKKSEDFSIKMPIINKSEVKLGAKVNIPPGAGLLFPPTYKEMIYTDERGNETPYYQWSFEITLDYRGHKVPVINAGTKALKNGEIFDICSWYIYSPEEGEVSKKMFGTFNEMMRDKKELDEFNKGVTDENAKKVWTGDFVQGPVPLTLDGEIDENAIENEGTTYIREYLHYSEDNWNLGWR